MKNLVGSSTRGWLASLPLLAVFLILFRAFHVADRLPTWAGVLLGISLSTVALQWGRVATGRSNRNAEIR